MGRGREEGRRQGPGRREESGERDWGCRMGRGGGGGKEEQRTGLEAVSADSALSPLNPTLSGVQGASVPGSTQASVPPARPPIPMLFSPLPSCQLS